MRDSELKAASRHARAHSRGVSQRPRACNNPTTVAILVRRPHAGVGGDRPIRDIYHRVPYHVEVRAPTHGAAGHGLPRDFIGTRKVIGGNLVRLQWVGRCVPNERDPSNPAPRVAARLWEE